MDMGEELDTNEDKYVHQHAQPHKNNHIIL